MSRKNSKNKQPSLKLLLIVMLFVIFGLSIYVIFVSMYWYNLGITEDSTNQQIAERQLLFSAINGFVSALVIGLLFAFISINFIMREDESNTEILLVNIKLLFEELKDASQNKDVSKMKHVAEKLYFILLAIPRKTKLDEESIKLCIQIMYEKIGLLDKSPIASINELIKNLDIRLAKHQQFIKERLGKK